MAIKKVKTKFTCLDVKTFGGNVSVRFTPVQKTVAKNEKDKVELGENDTFAAILKGGNVRLNFAPDSDEANCFEKGKEYFLTLEEAK